MLIDAIHRGNALEVSYICPDTKCIEVKRLIPPKGFSNWAACSEEDPARDPHIRNYDGGHVKSVPAKRFNDLGLLEYLSKRLPEDVGELLHAYAIPDFYSVDIETEIINEMPKADEALTRILSISITAPNMHTIVLTLKPVESAERVYSIVNAHLASYGGVYPVRIKPFETEVQMLTDFCDFMRRAMHCHGGWNYLGYDWPYIYNRCRRLGVPIEKASPVGEINKENMPTHRLIVDYMELYKDSTIGKYLTSFSLNAIAYHELGVTKIENEDGLKYLYNNKYDEFIAYNAVDSILVQLIHKRSSRIDGLLNMAYYTRMPVSKITGPIALTDALMFEEFWRDGKVMASLPPKQAVREFAGGYVKAPVRNVVNYPAVIDVASLYPSIMQAFNISPDTYMGKCRPTEASGHRAAGRVVTHNNTVYRADKPSVFKRIQAGLKTERGKYKKAKANIWENLFVALEGEMVARGLK